jgi:hypothetical protein
MTDAQLKALVFLRDTDNLDYTRASQWNYPHRSKLPCTGGALKVLIRSLENKGWIVNGAITDEGVAALTDHVNQQTEHAARAAHQLDNYEA